MSIDLSPLDNAQRLLFEIPLTPLQGQRFQPTGFPNLGAATYQTPSGACLLVESTQSMANRLELTIWDEVAHDVKAEARDLSHVRVMRGTGNSESERRKSKDREFLTDSITESHRINSPYVMFAEYGDSDVFDEMGRALSAFDAGPLPSRPDIAGFLLKWDVGSLLHGAFLSAKKKGTTLAGGRLRVARALSAFIEADGVRVAPSGGVKNDHVNPSGDTTAGFGNVPFARDEFTADRITLYVNLDLAAIRGYGLGPDVERLLVLLALYKLRALLDGGMRLRTACDLRVAADGIKAASPVGFALPDLRAVAEDLKTAIATCKDRMAVTEVTFNNDLKKGKEKDEGEISDAAADDDHDTEE
jgi:CRISPR-associated protein Csb1